MHGSAGASALQGYRAARARSRWRWLLPAVAAITAGLDRGPWWAAIAGALGLAAAGLWPQRDPERWLRGAEGERRTALVLDRLPARRWTVLHDLAVPGSRANIDHLVIGRTGVWVVDTKTTGAAVHTTWRAVRFGDRRLDPGPTRWEAEVVSDRLGVPARPIIAVHGALARRARAGRVPVVPAFDLERRLRRGRRRLSRADVAALSARAASVFTPAAVRPVKRTTTSG